MKKTISLLLALALCLGMCVPAFAAGMFIDVFGSNWACPYVERAARAGWVSGVGSGMYEPNTSVTYSQFAVMLDKALFAGDFAAQPAGAKWWTAPCEVAARHGLFADTDMADPSAWDSTANTPIEREQMAQMMYNALVDLKVELPSYEEYSEAVLGVGDIAGVDNYDAVATCYTIKLLNGDGSGNFDAHSDMTRAQAAVVLCNIHGYVNGTGQPADPNAPRPAGAVGGRYDVTVYDVPADANKDGWITEAEVQAVLDQLRIDYPDGSPWGSSDQWWSPVLGGGSECAGFAYMVSDRIFGTLPKYEVQMKDTRVGDVLDDGPAHHTNVVLNDYGALTYEGQPCPDQYLTADGNVSGEVWWGMVSDYSDWPAGTRGTVIYSRYPKA